jgi:Methyltransferase FkbM domain
LLIKIDVEGAEAAVLNGLIPLILAQQPKLVIEVLEPSVDQLNALRFLHENYWLCMIADDGLKELPELIAHANSRDYLLIPKRNEF